MKRLLISPAAIFGVCSAAAIGTAGDFDGFRFAKPQEYQTITLGPKQDTVPLEASGTSHPGRLQGPIRVVLHDAYGNAIRQAGAVVVEPNGTWRSPTLQIERDVESLEVFELDEQGAREFDAWQGRVIKNQKLMQLSGHRTLGTVQLKVIPAREP
jgi:hypothetical protein